MTNTNRVQVDNPVARRLWGLLQIRETWPIERLALECGCNKRQVHKALLELSELGLIRAYEEEE